MCRFFKVGQIFTRKHFETFFKRSAHKKQRRFFQINFSQACWRLEAAAVCSLSPGEAGVCSTSTCLTLPRHLSHLLPCLRSEESSRLVGILRDETLIHSGRMLEASAPSPRGPLGVTRPPAVLLTSRLSVIPSPLAQRAFPAPLKRRMSEEFKELSSGCFP